jgi:hypothetical protein
MDEYPSEITYKDLSWRRYPDYPDRSHRVYYQHHGSAKDGVWYLHREIWLDTHPGQEIPSGWHVHHVDENPLNNDPSNLACIPPQEHARVHPGNRPDQSEHLRAIRPLAAEWHRSQAGHEWHVEHAKRAWEDREPEYERTCASCGEKFLTFRPDATACSRVCRNRLREKQYLETVPCPICGNEFQRDKYRKRSATCSRLCGAQLRKRREGRL